MWAETSQSNRCLDLLQDTAVVIVLLLFTQSLSLSLLSNCGVLCYFPLEGSCTIQGPAWLVPTMESVTHSTGHILGDSWFLGAWMDTWIHGWMDEGCIDGRVHGQMEEWNLQCSPNYSVFSPVIGSWHKCQHSLESQVRHHVCPLQKRGKWAPGQPAL